MGFGIYFGGDTRIYHVKAGEWQDNSLNGQGRVHYDDHSVVQGTYIDSAPIDDEIEVQQQHLDWNGFVKDLALEDGSTYTGEYNTMGDGFAEGFGVRKYPDGSMYVGHFGLGFSPSQPGIHVTADFVATEYHSNEFPTPPTRPKSTPKPTPKPTLKPTTESDATQMCGYCGGTGQMLCWGCGGSGRPFMLLPPFDRICNGCSGDGLQKCTLCNGTGTRKSGGPQSTGSSIPKGMPQGKSIYIMMQSKSTFIQGLCANLATRKNSCPYFASFSASFFKQFLQTETNRYDSS